MFSVRKTAFLSMVLLFAFATTTFPMNKTVKGSLIGLGSGLVVGAFMAFYNTYDFKSNEMTHDGMRLVINWEVFVPVYIVAGGLIGSIAGYFSGEKKEKK